MASKFRNYRTEGITTSQAVLTGAVGVDTTIIGMTIANVGVGQATTDIKLESTYMLKGAPVFERGAMTPIGGEQKVVVAAGEVLSVASDVPVDVILSVLEKN